MIAAIEGIEGSYLQTVKRQPAIGVSKATACTVSLGSQVCFRELSPFSTVSTVPPKPIS